MPKIVAILTDHIYNFMSPAIIDLDTFEVLKLSSVYDTFEDYKPNVVGISVADYKAPVRLYETAIIEGKIYVKNTQAKKAIYRWSQHLNNNTAQQLLEKDQILQEKQVIQETIIANFNKDKKIKSKI